MKCSPPRWPWRRTWKASTARWMSSIHCGGFLLRKKTDQELAKSRKPHERCALLWLAHFERLREELQKGIQRICNAPPYQRASCSRRTSTWPPVAQTGRAYRHCAIGVHHGDSKERIIRHLYEVKLVRLVRRRYSCRASREGWSGQQWRILAFRVGPCETAWTTDTNARENFQISAYQCCRFACSRKLGSVAQAVYVANVAQWSTSGASRSATWPKAK